MSESILRKQLTPLLTDINSCLEHNICYAALSLALTLPDICSYLEKPKFKGRKAYINWVEKYFMNEFPMYKDFLSATDFYVLRCAFLHNGSDNVSTQESKDVVDKFKFNWSTSNNVFHNIKITQNGKTSLGLDVKIFCLEIIKSVEYFISINENKSNFNEHLLLHFDHDTDGFVM